MATEKVMQGFEESFIQKTKESVTPTSAILEFIDNSIDAKAKNVTITYKNNKLVVADDGKGMSITALNKWCSNVISHTSNGKNTIGLKGIGSKAALIALSNLSNTISKVEIITKTVNKDANRVVWVIAKSGKQITDTAYYREKTDIGTTFIVNDCVELDIESIKETIRNTYSQFKNKINITINNEVITFFDNCYLDLLGKDINNDGVYYKDGVAFVVKTYNATNIKEMTTLKLKAVHIYVTRLKEITKSGKFYKDAGVYCLFNNRYVNYGDNASAMFKEGIGARGGFNGVRTLLFIDNGNCDIMGIKSDKNNGITYLKENLSLKSFKIDDDTKTNVFNAIQTDFKYLRKLVDYEAKNKSIDKEYNELSVEIISKIFDGGFVKTRRSNNVIIINSVDDLENIIPELKTNSSPQTKEFLYYIHNSLSNGSLGKISRTKIDKFIKDFWNNFYCGNIIGNKFYRKAE